MSSSTPTIKAALKYAAELRHLGDQEAARDPYASPYRPTEASVRKLCSRFSQQATRELPVTATEHERDEARAAGPAKAIAYMTLRARQHGQAKAEQDLISERAEQRLKRRQEQARKQRDKERAHLTPGARIDGVIARLRLVAAPAAPTIGHDSVSSERDMTPAFNVDAAAKAVAVAMHAVRELERLEDSFKVRDLQVVA